MLGLARSDPRPEPLTLSMRNLHRFCDPNLVPWPWEGKRLQLPLWILAGESQASFDGAPFSGRPAGRSGRRAVWGKALAGGEEVSS